METSISQKNYMLEIQIIDFNIVFVVTCREIYMNFEVNVKFVLL